MSLLRRVQHFVHSRLLRGSSSPPPFLLVPGPCDLACAWCNYGHGEAVGFGSDIDRLRQELVALHARGHRAVGFGVLHTEPTTSPDFVEIVRIARRIGFNQLTLSTSGINLARHEYVRELAHAGLTKVILSLPGLDTARSDLLLAREGAARAKLLALEHCLSEGLETDAILMFLRPALSALPEAAMRVARIPGWRSRHLLTLSGCLMDPVIGMQPARHALLWPRYGEVVWTMRRIRRHLPAFLLYSTEMPVCVRERIAGVAGGRNERRSEGVLFVKPALACNGCDRHQCLGIYEGYWRDHGAPLLPESVEQEPSTPDLASLTRMLLDEDRKSLLRAAPPKGWQGEVSSALDRYHSGSEAIAGYRLTNAHQEGSALVTVWNSEGDRMVASIELRAFASRFFVAGSRFALSYRSDTPLDSAPRQELLRGILATLER